MKIGYIGSPGNLKDANVKKSIVELFSKLAGSAEIYVGPPNADLQEAVAGVQCQDMMEAAVDMFDAIIISPGGPGAEKEAKRFNMHSELYLFSNSASEFGSPQWFSELRATKTFDLKDLQVDRAADTVLEMPGVVEMKCTMKKPVSFYIKSAQAFLKGVDAVEAKEGKEAKKAKPPVEEMKISGLGEAINAAVSAAVRAEAEGLATITKVETRYPEMASSRGCAQIVLTLKRK